jgi:N-sulfoglucosamine sulfohydrolase
MQRFVIGGVLILATVVGGLPSAAQADTPPAPNILFLFADDWGRQASAYAALDAADGLSRIVQTPNFDRLAAEGTLFRSAFVNAPSCTPCRSSLLSGQHFWKTGRGAILQGARWDESIPSWPLLLADAGYHIGKSLKVWTPGTPTDAPIGGQRFAYERAGTRFNRFSQQIAEQLALGKELEVAREELLAEVQQNFEQFLDARPDDRPFCYWFGPTNTHRTWVAGSGEQHWGIAPDRLRGSLPPFLPDVDVIREDMADYLGEIQAFDAGIGRLLAVLERRGELEQTLVVVSGDHGPPGFLRGKCNLYDFGTAVPLVIRGPGVARGEVADPLVSLIDLAPTLLEAAGVPVPDVMDGKSLWPLLSGRTREQRAAWEREAVLFGRERHVEMAREGYLPYPQRGIRTAEFLYIVNFEPQRYPMGDPYHLDRDVESVSAETIARHTFATLADEDASPTKAWMVVHQDDPQWRRLYGLAFEPRPREELYDLAADPHQINNLADDPDYQQVRRDLERQLLGRLEASGDPRLIDGGAYFERPPLAGPLPEDVPHPNRGRAAGPRRR